MHFAVTADQRESGDNLQGMLAETDDFDSRRKRLRAAELDRMAATYTTTPPAGALGAVPARGLSAPADRCEKGVA